jgi:acyl-CoA synthetase (NDP forming)
VSSDALRALFAPRGIALFGASGDPGKISGKPLAYLRKHGFPGRLLVVNPRYAELGGVPCVPALDAAAAAGGPLDLAVVALGQDLVEDALEQCRAAGVRAAVILGSGYAETGEAGRARQTALAARARAAGVRLLGPNCQGFINVADRVAASFSPALEVPALTPGGLALVTQSGALGGVLLNRARERGLGLAFWASTGNEADVTWLDGVAFALSHPATRVVAAYAESVPDGRRLLALGAEARARQVPLVVLAGGLSEGGRLAAVSHTGVMLGAGRVARAALEEAGLVRAGGLDELLEIAEALGTGPPPAGPRLAVLTTSGGAGVLVADALEGTPVRLAELAPGSEAALRDLLPPFAAPRNPVDVTAQVITQPDLLRRALEATLADPGVDAALVALTMVTGDLAAAVARGLAAAAGSGGKPVVVAWMAGALAEAGYALLREAGVPCFPTLRGSLAALGGVARWAQARTQPVRAAGPAGAGAARVPPGALTERAARAVLALYGVRGPREAFAAGPEEAGAAAAALGYPVVLKVEAPGLSHKTEAGGVRLGLTDRGAVEAAARAMLAGVRAAAPGAAVRGFLVQEQAAGVAELLVGATRDPRFGAVVTCGLGGIFAEALGDVALRLAPVDEGEARAMLEELRGFPLLAGARGRPPADLGAAAAAVAAVSRLAVDLGDRLEALEVNPLVVAAAGGGAVAVDALLQTRPPEGAP